MLHGRAVDTLVDQKPIHTVNGDYKGYKLVVSGWAP